VVRDHRRGRLHRSYLCGDLLARGHRVHVLDDLMSVSIKGFDEMSRRVPDTAKIGAVLDWRPRMSLGETLADVIADQRSDGPAQAAAMLNGS
jgi:hypothetical protein